MVSTVGAAPPRGVGGSRRGRGAARVTGPMALLAVLAVGAAHSGLVAAGAATAAFLLAVPRWRRRCREPELPAQRWSPPVTTLERAVAPGRQIDR